MGKATRKVRDLVSAIESGDLRLPEMQRRYVWRSTQVRDLLDSLYRGYPSGTILVWETREKVPTRDFAVAQGDQLMSKVQLLLDGQQRLTSLSAILRGEPVNVRNRKRPIEILFNLEHPEKLSVVTEVEENDADEVDEEEDTDAEDGEDIGDASEDELLKRFAQMTFVVGSKRLERLPNWVSVTEVMTSNSDRKIMKDAGVTMEDESKYDKYSERLTRLRAIKDYEYNLHVLEEHMSYEEVTEIFVRVNSLGAKLRSSDLAMAQITAKWRDSLKIFEGLREEFKRNGFDIDLGVVVKNLVAWITGQSRFLTVGSISKEELQEAWPTSVKGLQFAVNFLKSNVRIDSPALLTSPFALIAIAYYGLHKKGQLTPEEERQLRYWTLVANTKGRYSRGSSETILDQDLTAIAQGKGIEHLIELLRLQFGRLDVIPEDLEGRNQRSGVFRTMFLAFRDAGAKDWQSNLQISVSHHGKTDKLQFHHVFPKAVLRRAGYGAKEANDISNFAFIGGRTNRTISSKEPLQYFPDLIAKQGVASFSAQVIPTDEPLLAVTAYPDFLKERRQRIADRVNQYLLG